MLHEVITDANFGLEQKPMNNPTTRIGARGIVIHPDNKIAIFFKRNMNEYKLPGGGVEDNEKPEVAFKREVLEETGCKVEILSKLGTTEEFKSHTNFYQLSHVFIGKVLEKTTHAHLTKKEVVEGGELIWISLDEAINNIEQCLSKLKPSPIDKNEGLYSTRFIVKRDLSILKYYKQNLDKYSF